MKAIYKLMFWFIFFESTIVLVSFIDVFPADAMFFSDFEMETMQQHLVDGNYAGLIGYLFKPPIEIPGVTDEVFSIGLLISIFLIGTGLAIFTQSYVPFVIAIIGASFYPMLTHSLGMFRKIFIYGDNQALLVLGTILGLGAVIAFVFAMVESATHGES